MHNDVKKSLDTIFEHEKLGKSRKQKRHKTPYFVGIAAICIAIFLVILNQVDHPKTTTHSVEQQTQSIFHLKGSYIGKNTISYEIAHYVLEDYALKNYALHTTEKPYGMTYFVNEEIPPSMQLKYAFYMFTLVQNCSYVILDYNGEQKRYDRETFEQTSNMQFEAIETEQQLLTAYFNALISFSDLPQLQTHKEHVYKHLFNAKNSDEVVKNSKLDQLPDYTFQLDNEQFFMWIEKSAIFIMNNATPQKLTKVTGQLFEDIRKMINTEINMK